MPEKLRADLMVLDPLVCRSFGIEVGYFQRESSKFDYDGQAKLGSAGFVNIGPEFMLHVKA